MLKQKILLLLLVISLIGTFFGVVHASFDNTAIKNDNILTSGNLNLKVDDNDGASATILTKGMSPGDIMGPASITLTNSGYISGSTLNIRFSYTNRSDTQSPDADLSRLTGIEALKSKYLIIQLTASNGVKDSEIYDIVIRINFTINR